MKNQTADIFLSKNVESSFSASAALSLVLNNLNETFLIVDKDLKIIVTNEHTRQTISRLLKHEVGHGTSVLQMVPPERRPELILLYQEVFRGKEQKSETIVEKENGTFYFENVFRPALNEVGEIVGALVTSRDITDTRKAEQVLKKIEERWRFALESGKQNVWDWNIQTGEIFFSYKELFGEGNDSLNHFDEWKALLHDDDRLMMENKLREHQVSSEPYHQSTYRIKVKDGSYKWILSRGMLISRDETGRALRMIGTHTDITEQVKAEEKIKASEQQYKSLFHSNPLPCWIYDTATLAFLEVNEAAIQHYGFSKEEFLNGNLFMIHPPEQRKCLEDKNNKAGNPSTEALNNWKQWKKDGDRIYVDLRISPIDYKEYDAKLVVAHDVTAKVLVEKELRKSNERFTFAAKALSEALWEWDVSTGEFYTSQAYTDLFGWKADEERKFDEWHHYIHPADRDVTIREYYAAIENAETEKWSHEYRYLKSDGNYANVIDTAIILRDETGKAVKVIGAIQDVTGQKLAEEELKKSNERYLIVTRATSDAIYDWDLVCNDIHWGEGMHTLFGYNINDISIKQWEELIHEDDRKKINSSLNEALHQKELQFWKEEYRFLTKEGIYSYVLDRGYILRDHNGDAIRMIGSMQDISERKSNEQLLSLERSILELSTNPNIPIREIIENLLTGIEEIHTDAFTSVLLLNDNDTLEPFAAPRLAPDFFNQFRGVKIGPDAGCGGSSMYHRKTIFTEKIETDPHWQNFKTSAALSGLISCWSLPVMHSSGKVLGCISVYYKYQKMPTPREHNTFERIKNILRVLLEHSWSLNEIKVANERFDIIQKATHDLIWDWNLITNDIYRDEAGLLKVYGLSSNEPIKLITQWMERLHPEDKPNAQALFSVILGSTDEKNFELQYRFRRDDNTYSYVYDRAMIIRNEEGRPIRMIGAAQDITERKRLEQELLQNELERQKAINQATVDTQEQERSEIGKELHDNVNQVLTTTKLYLDLASTNAELKDDLIQKSTRNIVSVINEIRQLSRSLMDPSIGDLGLVDSIKDLAANINLTRKLQVVLKIQQKIETLLDKNQKLTIFRIIQETLNNAIRHSKATRVEIVFKTLKSVMEIHIQDNGIGFEPDYIKKGAGLKNIQNRIYLINGSHTLQSAPGKGCTIIIKFPITK